MTAERGVRILLDDEVCVSVAPCQHVSRLSMHVYVRACLRE
jgi:hypothetical protein